MPGYALTAEIARGGMGCVFAGRDLRLDREVAIKTLLPGADAGRFVTESKITARLPHPNIPPVYALGKLADGTPFLAMKLVRGQTLAFELKQRPDPAHDLPRFVSIFEQIAQAVGFAHAQGVIHRDLKPANVMVGAFGEVQVMDWGLARATRGEAGEERREENVDSSFASALQTAAGAIMGTPAFMAPEQARGEPVDERADVFALGGILAAILTGSPPFAGGSAIGTLQMAARADLEDCFEELDECGADDELLDLAEWCLGATPAERPANGHVVAEAVAKYRAGVEDRLRAAETARAVTATQAEAEHKRRRLFARSAAAVIAVLLLGIAASVFFLLRAQNAEGVALGEKVKAEQETIRANEKEREANRREGEERKARLRAEYQQKIAEKTRVFLSNYFAVRSSGIGGGVVGGPSGPNVTLREVIEFAESQIGKEFEGYPEAEFDLRLTFAAMHLTLNNTDGYAAHVKRARELGKQLKLENSSDFRTLEASGMMSTALRGGTVSPALLASFQGAVPSSATGTTADEVKVMERVVAGSFAALKKDMTAALKEFRAAVELSERSVGSSAPQTLMTRLLLGSILAASDQAEQALTELDAVVANGQKVPWGQLPVALARAFSLGVRVRAVEDDDRAVLALADGAEQSAREFDRLGMWDTDYGAGLALALARVWQAQKRHREAAELLARAYRTAIKNPAYPVGEFAYRAGLAYVKLTDWHEVDFYLTAAMEHPSWATASEERQAKARSLRGKSRILLGRHAAAEPDLRSEIPRMLRGPAEDKFAAACMGAAIGRRDYLKPYMDTVFADAPRRDADAESAIQNVRRLATFAQQERRFALAAELNTTFIALSGKYLGPNVPIDVARDRGQCFEALGRFEDAIGDYRAALNPSRQTFGDADPKTRAVADDLARVLGLAGRPAEGIAVRKQTFAATRVALGYTSDATWEDAARLLVACRALGDYSALDPKARTIADGAAALAGTDEVGLANQARLAKQLKALRPALAVELLAEVARAQAEALGDLVAPTLQTVVDLSDLCRARGDHAPAVPALERVVKQIEKGKFAHPNAANWLNELADALESCDRAGDAEPWRRKLVEVVAGAAGAESPGATSAGAALGVNLLLQTKWAEAETVLRKALAVRERLAPNAWTTFHTRSLLGAALLGQKNLAAAEPLLRSGYEGMTARERFLPLASRPRLLTDAADRLIELATAKGDAEALEAWKAERERHKPLAPMPRARK